MDKLKPILAQKFWIFFGIVLILPVVGYFMTTGELAAQIKTRMESLESTFKGIPAGTDSPNEQWSTGLQLLNEKQRLHNLTANLKLWEVQKAKMRWPEDIAAVMSKAEYFKPVPPEQGGTDAQHKYQYDYPREIRRLWEIVDPMDDGMNQRDSDKRRKIAFPMANLHQTNTGRWAELPPTHEDIWQCQEDIWLQTELLQAIARVNANAISQGDAFVKQLDKILLFGGATATATGDAGGASPSAAPGGSPYSGQEAAMFGGGGMPGMGGGGRRSDSAALSAEINVGEEFTVANDPNVLSGGGVSGGGAGGGMGKAYPTESGGMPQQPGGSGGEKSDIKRYIDEDENQPYKRRGFSIKVVMDHTKVPDLIAELMNSPFPVEIVRVQQVWLSDMASPPGGGGGSPYMASGGATPYPNPSFKAPGGAEFTPAFAPGDDAGAGLSGGGNPMRTGTSGTGSQAAAMSDPNLAQVAILGVWTLYRPPAPAPNAGQAAPGSASPNPEVVSTPAAAAQENSVNATTSTKPAASESTDATSAESKKPESGDASSAEPAKPEKKEPASDVDKPTDESK